MMLFSIESLTPAQQYKLMVATVVPRPIAWVTTRHPSGTLNCSPFSFFNTFHGEPPVVALGLSARHRDLAKPDPGPALGMKDTRTNIATTGEFVINLVSYELREAMNITAMEFAPEDDELAAANLETAASVKVGPPRIAKSPVSYECRRFEMLDIGGGATLVLGRVLAVHVQDDAVLDREGCYIDVTKLDLVARMHGRGWYARTTALFEMPSRDIGAWAKENGTARKRVPPTK
jgi:flavin reductase (DIM6/NTAB) family NADH-FMN oxidoreductase RutF